MNLSDRVLKELYEKVKKENPDRSLDELLHEAFKTVKTSDIDSFEDFRALILKANNINEYDFYTKNVNPELKKYIESNIFPEYEKNDQGHGILHIREVIRRGFALNSTLKLGLDENMIYAITACHDVGKYIDHENHNFIAAKIFIENEDMKKFFTDEQRNIIKEAIEDHRSSLEDVPRSIYGKLVSSADRNTRIEIVFIRSFFVGKWRTPDENVEDFLDFTFKRLTKRYSKEKPENMFLEDETYKTFLKDMRNLLKDEVRFKNRYCEVNHIKSRKNKLSDEKGETSYIAGNSDYDMSR
ncbi:MAG TPA: HD domain-containing protein [Candidatus Scatovivens faecipullorum]|nr:HD domain-containing protein [Candidatus Scatovivens faecipullorum]